MKPEISIIVPIYNAAPYLHRCIDSILSQSFADYELLLIDDGSTDGSGALCDEYAVKDSRIRIFHKKNDGSAAARQYGFIRTKGKYVTAIDSDDWVDPTYLEDMFMCMQNNDADCVVCAYWLNRDNQDIYIENKPSQYDNKTLSMEVLEHKYHAGLWNKMFKRSVLMNEYMKSPITNYYEDMYVYVLFLQYASKVVYSNHATYHYCYNTTSMTNDKDAQKRITMLHQMLINMSDLYDNLDEQTREDLQGAFYFCVNCEKFRILYEYPRAYMQYKGLFKSYFPQSKSIINVKGFTTLIRYLALSGIVLPYHVLMKR